MRHVHHILSCAPQSNHSIYILPSNSEHVPILSSFQEAQGNMPVIEPVTEFTSCMYLSPTAQILLLHFLLANLFTGMYDRYPVPWYSEYTIWIAPHPLWYNLIFLCSLDIQHISSDYTPICSLSHKIPVKFPLFPSTPTVGKHSHYLPFAPLLFIVFSYSQNLCSTTWYHHYIPINAPISHK